MLIKRNRIGNFGLGRGQAYVEKRKESRIIGINKAPILRERRQIFPRNKLKKKQQ